MSTEGHRGRAEARRANVAVAIMPRDEGTWRGAGRLPQAVRWCAQAAELASPPTLPGHTRQRWRFHGSASACGDGSRRHARRAQHRLWVGVASGATDGARWLCGARRRRQRGSSCATSRVFTSRAGPQRWPPAPTPRLLATAFTPTRAATLPRRSRRSARPSRRRRLTAWRNSSSATASSPPARRNTPPPPPTTHHSTPDSPRRSAPSAARSARLPTLLSAWRTTTSPTC